MKLSVVVPAYNEENGIQLTLNELESYLREFRQCETWEIIVVNDGSSDGTLGILSDLSRTRTWLRTVDLGRNYGRGKAVRAGIDAADGDIIVTLDADLSYAPYHIERMVTKMTESKADVVLASAYGKGGTVQQVPFFRLMLSRLGNVVLSYMFDSDISVLTCMVRAFRKEFIKSLDLHENDKDIHLEILYKAKLLGARIVEVPADLKWRKEKPAKKQKTAKRRSTLKLKKTSGSHFLFALMNKPGFLFIFVGLALFLLSAGFFLRMLILVIIPNLMIGESTYHAVRNSMLTGTLTWMTIALFFILSIQFLSFGFITNQIKKNHEESYRTIHTIMAELKKSRLNN